jgi:hypothetical protein
MTTSLPLPTHSATFAAVDATPSCSRLGCSEPAVAVFAFDARECLVWLDPLSGPARGAGVLCEVHADRLSPPRGWNLLDRRAAESRLWTGRAPVTTSWTAPHGSRRSRSTRARPCAPSGTPLPFDAPESPLDPAPEPAPWSPHARPGPDFDHVLDARTPLLARAFEAARPTDD